MSNALVAIAACAFAATACAAPSGEVPEIPEADAPVAVASHAVVASPAAADAASPPAMEPVPAFEIPDVTAQRITRDDLTVMLPPGTRTIASRTNEDLVVSAVLDREDEASDIVLFGRVTGVAAAYGEPANSHVWIDLLPDAGTAHSYLLDAAGDIFKGMGGTHAPGVGAGSAIEFAVDVGDQSIGIIAELADGRGTETLILARAGRVVFYASHIHPRNDDARVRTQYLADDVLDGIMRTLTDSGVDTTSLEHPRYRFHTTTTVIDDAGRTLVTATGIVDGTDRSCTIEVSGPDSRATHELVQIGDLVWWRTGSGTFETAAPGNLTAASLLVACPAWPLDVESAGLTAVMSETSPIPHQVNGVDAVGHRSDAAGLATVLGSDMPAATVHGFSFWVAEDAQWVVELAISMTGPAEVRRLLTGPVAEPIGMGTISIRHRTFEIGAVDASIVPPA